MDNRTVVFSYDEFVVQPEKIGDALNDICNNLPLKYELRGCAVLSRKIMFMLEKKHSVGDVVNYYVDEIGPVSDSEMVGIINGRWQGGYTTIAVMPICGSCFGVFEKRIVIDE